MKTLTAEQEQVMNEWLLEQVAHEEEVRAFWDEQCAQPLTVDRSELPF